ncbi:hypothetical protein ACJMK2_019364 [Sinanodonta woodiana]|uniref:Uncharacterized protein n=1 Tax=Sinanodonta woodiana TaxID=1069815 RepID=A0ABD3UIZ6_SINWO
MLVFIVLCLVYNTRYVHGENLTVTEKDANGAQFNTVYPLSNDSNCSLLVEHITGVYLEHWIGVLQPQFAHFNLLMKNDVVASALPTVIRPTKWVWTYHPPNNVNPYLHWPVDFPILSFSLLCAKCLEKDVNIFMNASSPNCKLVYGSHDTSLSIATALNEMTQNYLVQFQTTYNYSYWCYLAEIPGVRDTFAYKFALYFKYPVDVIGYKCCNSSFNYYTENIVVDCPEEMKEKWSASTLGPYIIGLVLLCYFPLILCRWSETLVKTEEQIPAQCHYEDLEDKDRRQWVYLDGHSPISLTNLLCGLCGLSWTHPVAMSRLRRALFVLFSPVLIVLQLLLYSTYQGDITLDLIDHGVPMGFLGMLGGVEKSKKIFVPLLGGPHCLLFMYYVTGFIFLLVPRNLEDVIQQGSLDAKCAGLSPLSLRTERIEEISMVPVNQHYGYKRLSMLLLARFYLIMMPRFWFEAFLIIWRRIKRQFDFVVKHLPMPLVFILSCVMFPLHIIIGILELCFSLIYYSIPIIWFLSVVINGFVSRTTSIIQAKSPLTMPHSRRIILRVAMYIITGPLLLYFVYGFFAIYLSSFSIVGEIIVFLFYALVLFPSSSFGYLFFGGALLYYVWKLLKGIGDVYYELLSDIVEICSNLDLDHNIPRLHNSTVIVEVSPGVTVTALRVNNRTITLTEEQANNIHAPANARIRNYINYKKHVPGVSRRLFKYVVRKYKPVHITVFQAIFRIGLIVLLVIGTMRITMSPNGMSTEISEVMHVIFIVAIGALPKILEITLSQTDKVVHKEIHLRLIETIIHEYNQSTMELFDHVEY